ncbi:MAG: membrane protein insertion efficiency factor YidD [Acetobacteraceae bacterium]
MRSARSPEAGQTSGTARFPSVVAQAAIGAAIAYQWTIRPVIGAHCRFWPSCSDYAIDALRRHGAVRGGALAARRVLRCNPWHEGGWDPVPEPNRPTGH